MVTEKPITALENHPSHPSHPSILHNSSDEPATDVLEYDNGSVRIDLTKREISFTHPERPDLVITIDMTHGKKQLREIQYQEAVKQGINSDTLERGIKSYYEALDKRPVFYIGSCKYNHIHEIPLDSHEIDDVNSEQFKKHGFQSPMYFLKQLKQFKFSNGKPVFTDSDKLSWYAKLCYAFWHHLEGIDRSYITCNGVNTETGEDYDMVINLQYRTSYGYKKRNVARTHALLREIKSLDRKEIKKELWSLEKELEFKTKAYERFALCEFVTRGLLERMCEIQKRIKELKNMFDLCDFKQDVTIVTFTGSPFDENGNVIDFIQQNERVQEGKRKIHDMIRKNHKGVPYLSVTEPHKSGYLHYHVVYACEIPKDEQIKLKSIWSENYKIGSFDNGLDFSFTKDSSIPKKKKGQREYKNDTDSALRYAAKYVAKDMQSDVGKLYNDLDNAKKEWHYIGKGKEANNSEQFIQKAKSVQEYEIYRLRCEIREQEFTRGKYPISKLLADACMWYVSKHTITRKKGIRSFFISQKWNCLIR